VKAAEGWRGIDHALDSERPVGRCGGGSRGQGEFEAHHEALAMPGTGLAMMAATYWYCNKMVNPPKTDEVNSAVSYLTLSYLNTYIKNSKEEGKLFEMDDVDFHEYKCVGIYDPGKSTCDRSSSLNCEYFWSSATADDIIEVHEPTYISEKDEMIGMPEKTRFYWIYHRMYGQAIDDPLTNKIQSKVKDICLEEFDLTDIQQILNNACQEYESILDDYVDCSWEISCFSENSNDCVNSNCMREIYDDPCYPEAKSVDKKNVYFQSDQGSLIFKIILTDNKYLLVTADKKTIPLVWNIWGMITFDPPEVCQPVTTTVTLEKQETTTTVQITTTSVTTTTEELQTTTTRRRLLTTTTIRITTTTLEPAPDPDW